MIHRVLLVTAVLLGLLPGGWSMSSSHETLVVNTGERFQEIEGFGASGAWWAQDVGGWDEPNRSRLIELLFDREKGIGLSIYRYNIGGGAGDNIIDPWRRTETFELEPGVYDWSADANAVWVLRAAHAAGVEKFVVFANSPPARMTVSSKVTGGDDGESNLQPGMADDFARYMVDIVRHLRKDEGVPIGWISPINEPQWPWQAKNGQEGCHYTTDEILVVVRALLEAIGESGMDVKVSTPEAGEWKFAQVYVKALFGEDPDVARQLDHFAVHSYWSDLDHKLRLAEYVRREHPQVRLWMSEWTEMQEGRDYGMDSALVLANVIHDDVALAGVTSWQYWIAVSKYNFRDGLIYTDAYKQNIRETKRLWAMGNYSRYVRPGYVRVGAESSSETLRASAYVSPAGETLVVVVINNAAEARAADLSVVADRSFNALEIHETSEEANLRLVYSGDPVPLAEFTPHSVTTLVLR